MTLLTILLYILVFAIFITFSVIIFYHFSRYSLIGDLSKKIYFAYIIAGLSVLFVGLVGIILNHILNAP